MVTGPGFDLGTATGRIILDASGVGAGVNEARNIFQSGLNDISGMVDGLGRQMSTIGQSLTVLTAPFSGALIAGGKAAMDFDSAMREISARTGIVGADLQKISDFALQMGADTVFSGQQAAEAFLQLLSSGQNAEQAIATLPAVLNLAAASGDDLGRTADVLTDIMAAYGLSVDDATMVTDSLARAAASSSADVGSLGLGFANVGGVARQFGLSVDQTSAVLAIFAERGVKGAEAGTQLKSMLLNMTRDTPEVQAAWAELGTSMFDAEGNLRDLGVVMEEIRVAMQDKSPEEQIRLFKDLGGSYGFVGLQALVAGMSIEEMQALMADQADAATIAQIQMASFANTLGSFIGSLEALAITVLIPFMEDALKPMIEEGIRLVNLVTDWAKENPELAGTIVRVVAAVSVLGPVLVVAGAAMQALAPIIALVGALMGILLSPIALLIIGVGLLALAWATNWNDIRDKVQEVAGPIGESIRTNILPGLTDIRDRIQDAASGITGLDFTGLSTEVSTGLATAMTDVQSAEIDLTPVATWATDNANAILSTVTGVVGIVLGGPIGAVIGAARLISVAIETDFMGFGTFIEQSGIRASIDSGVQTLRGIIEGAFQSLLGGGGGTAQNSGAALAEEFASGMAVQQEGGGGPLIDTITTLISRIKRGIELFTPELSESIQQIADGIKGFVDGLSGADTSGLDNIAASVLSFFTNVASIVGTLMGLGLDIITDIFANVMPAIGTGIAGLITVISGIGEGDPSLILQGVATGLGAFIDAITGAVAGFADPLIEAINTLTGGNLPLLSTIFGETKDKLQELWDKAVEVTQPIIDEIQKLVNWFFDEETGLGSVVNFLRDVVMVQVDLFSGNLIGLWDRVREPLENFKNGLKRIFDWIKENVLDPVKKAIDDLAGALNSLLESAGVAPARASGGASGSWEIESRDVGGRGMAGRPYMIGTGAQPELYIPNTNGTFIPNADKLGKGVHVEQIIINPQINPAAGPVNEQARDFGRLILQELDAL